MSPELQSVRQRHRQGYLALILVQVFFGLFPVFIKLASDGGRGFTPRALAAWRIAVAALVLGGLALRRDGRRTLPRRADLPRLFACGLLGIVFNQVLALEGIVRTNVVDAGLLMTLIPVFTYALAVLVGQELLRGRRAGGIALALAGAVLLALPSGEGAPTASGGPSGARVTGNLLIMANCASYAGYLVLARPLLARYSALTVIAWVFVLALPTLPIVAWGVPLLPLEGSRGVWLALAYVLVFPTVLAYLLNTWALARVSASTTAVFIYLQPFIAGLGAWLAFGEGLRSAAALAALLLFGGIWLVTITPARAVPAAGET